MRRPPEPRPPEGPEALLDHYDSELRPAMRRIRRARKAYAFMYAFTIAVNAMGAVIVHEWWRWACLVIAVGMALALRSHLRQMREEASKWHRFEAQTEEFRRRVHDQ